MRPIDAENFTEESDNNIQATKNVDYSGYR